LRSARHAAAFSCSFFRSGRRRRFGRLDRQRWNIGSGRKLPWVYR
jgi:hypothetical protein